MACRKQYFAKVTDRVWHRIVVGVRDIGVEMRDHSGQASARGFTFAWHYEPGGETVWLQCVQKPFLIPCSMVEDRVKMRVLACGAVEGDVVVSA